MPHYLLRCCEKKNSVTQAIGIINGSDHGSDHRKSTQSMDQSTDHTYIRVTDKIGTKQESVASSMVQTTTDTRR